MNPMGVVAFFLASVSLLASDPPQVSTNLAVFDFIGDGNTDLVYEYSYSLVGDLATGSAGVIPTDGSVLLGRTTKDSFFESGAEISGSSPSYLNPNTEQNVAPLCGFIAQWDSSANIWYYFQAGGNSPIGAGLRTDVLIGVRIRTEDGPHFAWVRFVRPDSKPETLFTVGGFDWNPVPNAPIRAGFPPAIPVASEILPESAGVRLYWPPGTSSWILESTRSLSPLVVWEPYPAGGTSADLPPEDADRFFRLRRPE
ncbi:MAG: hypothetical protein U1G08_14165 [Verrucomicrobiota bacterium]